MTEPVHYFDFDIGESAPRYEADLGEIRRTFLMQDEDVVTAYLCDHGTIPPMLLQAVPHL